MFQTAGSSSSQTSKVSNVYDHYMSDNNQRTFSDNFLNFMKNFNINDVYNKECIEIDFNNNNYDLKLNDHIAKFNEFKLQEIKQKTKKGIKKEIKEIKLTTTYLYRFKDDLSFLHDFEGFPEFYKYFNDNYVLTQNGYKFILIYKNDKETKSDSNKFYYIEPIFKFILFNSSGICKFEDNLTDYNIYKKRLDLPYLKFYNKNRFFLEYDRLYEYNLSDNLKKDIIYNDTLFYIDLGINTKLREFNKQTLYDMIDEDFRNNDDFNIDYIIDLFNIMKVFYPIHKTKNKNILLYLNCLIEFYYYFSIMEYSIKNLTEDLEIKITDNTPSFQVNFIKSIERFARMARMVNIKFDLFECNINSLNINDFSDFKLLDLVSNSMKKKINYVNELYKCVRNFYNEYKNISYDSILMYKQNIPRCQYKPLQILLNDYKSLCKEY